MALIRLMLRYSIMASQEAVIHSYKSTVVLHCEPVAGLSNPDSEELLASMLFAEVVAEQGFL